MRSKRLSIEVGCYERDPEREEVWQPVPASKRNTADMLAEYSAAILIKGYRAYLRGDYVESRYFQQFLERGKHNLELEGEKPPEVICSRSISRLRRMESRYQWALTIRENVSHFILNMTGFSNNCRLRDAVTRPPRRSHHGPMYHATHSRLSA